MASSASAAADTNHPGSIITATSVTSKRVVYVGGLSDKSTAAGLRSAFIPFGPIQSVDVPMDYVAGKHRGFAFVEYKHADDAHEAVFNMEGAEYMGKVLRVKLAQPNQMNKIGGAGAAASSGATPASTNEAIWKSDEWYQQHIVGGGGGSDGAAGGNVGEADAATAQRHQDDIKALR